MLCTMWLMRQEASLTFGAEVRRLRKQAGLTQEALAERLSITREAISQIETGKTQVPGKDILLGLEQVLGLSRQRAYDLIGELDQETQDSLDVLLIQIAALPDRDKRRQALLSLPDPVRDAILRIAGDVWQDAIQQLMATYPPPLADQDQTGRS